MTKKCIDISYNVDLFPVLVEDDHTNPLQLLIGSVSFGTLTAADIEEPDE